MTAFTPADYSAIFLSLKVAVVATLISLPFGFAVAYLMTYHRFRGRVALDVVVNLPLTLPPVVIGYLLLMLLGQSGWIGKQMLQPLGIKLIFTWKAAVIATAVVGFPLMVRSIRTGMETIDERLIEASRTLGAGWLDTDPDRDPAPFRAGTYRRLGAHVRQGIGRVRGHDHRGGQYPRGDPDYTPRDL